MFEQSLMEVTRARTNPWSMAASFMLQTSLVGLALLVPMVFTDQIHPAQMFVKLEAPPPPGAPAAPAPMVQKMVAQVTRTVRDAIVLPNIVQPTRIPATVQLVVDQIDDAVGVIAAGTNIFGIGGPGGVPNGVIGGMDVPSRPPPTPTLAPKPAAQSAVTRTTVATPAKSDAPIRIGGQVQAARLIHTVDPIYPPLAKQARISGTVQLDAIVGRDGHVRNLRLISGHPLLVGAALDAVKQWVYQPTILNGEATEVVAVVSVTFRLN